MKSKGAILGAVFFLAGSGFFLSSARADETTPEQKISALGLVLPETPAPLANYVPAVRSGRLVFISGQVPRDAAGKFITGKLGRDLTAEQGTEAARLCTLRLISALKAETGDLSKVTRIVRLTGFVNGTDTFTDQSKVLNGASDLLVAVFGDKGRHARVATGVNSLPAGVPVELELIAEVAN